MDFNEQQLFEGALEIAKPLIEKAKEILVDTEKVLTVKVQKEYVPLLEDLKKNLITGEIKGIAYGEKVGVLDKATLVGFSKKHRPSGVCNQVVALKIKDTESYFIYLAYAHDLFILPNDFNHYVIIQAAHLANDVEQLFGDSELIILK